MGCRQASPAARTPPDWPRTGGGEPIDPLVAVAALVVFDRRTRSGRRVGSVDVLCGASFAP